MILKRIKICNFKNIGDADLEFSPKVNGFLGNNGMGKSNLLDAIYYLSFCKSFSGMTDSMLLRRGEDFMLVQGAYLRRGLDEDVSIGMNRGKRKSLRRQGKEYQRLSAHIGAFPLVMSSPEDIELIRGSSDSRRRLMDMVISQSDHIYLDELIRYGRALEQRNKLLRDGVTDRNLFLAVEIAMERAAAYIHSARADWIEKLTAIFRRYYESIAGTSEQVSLTYDSSLNAPGSSMSALLDSARHRDELLRHTSVGPHRDDIEMLIDGMPMRRAASQGQCKTYSIALRLAQYDFLYSTLDGIKPLLLLDDIFDKLDTSRVEKIMKVVTGSGFGQIFVTDTNRTHLDEIMSHTAGDYSLWNVADGTFNPLSH
ncbi:MAG: DNA replication and repair protein RecF [Muribaculum sp.]|nr:DNA replication and repair protein RecF [Muribaculum sp.]